MLEMGPLPAALGKVLLSLSIAPGVPGDLGTVAEAEQTTCTYDEPSKTVTVSPADAAFVVLSVESGAITFVGEQRMSRTSAGEPCGAATTTNTDVIKFLDGLGGFFGILEETTGTFAPGATVEVSGVSEIEIEFHADGFLVMGGSTEQRVARLGTLGANVNGDDDVDVTFLTDAGFVFVGGPADDDIAGTGGLGTGDPSTRFFVAVGADGADLLVAGPGNAALEGGAGQDLLVGGPAADSLSGGTDNDRLIGGGADDELAGDKGNDDLRGGPGPDEMNGGRGRDRCVGGPGKDKLENCER
jgi:Ca2+-binding RTX toxin-like protein